MDTTPHQPNQMPDPLNQSPRPSDDPQVSNVSPAPVSSGDADLNEHDRWHNLKSEANELWDNLKTRADRGWDNSREALDDAGDHAREKWNHFMQETREFWHDAKDETGEFRDDAKVKLGEWRDKARGWWNRVRDRDDQEEGTRPLTGLHPNEDIPPSGAW